MEYVTSDLGLTAYLATKFPLVRIQTIEGQTKKKAFVFKNSQELAKETSSYWNNTAKIEPNTYFQSIKSLKTRLYSENM